MAMWAGGLRSAGIRYLLQPSFPPENHAGLLAAIMRGTGTAQIFEDDDIVCPEGAHGGASSRGASLHHAPENLEMLAAELRHFRHEWQKVHGSLGIEGLQDLLGTFHFDKVAGVKSTWGRH